MAHKKIEENRSGNAVIIVESPAKTKTISRILGPGYDVLATMGHIRDLPKNTLGIDVDDDFALEYTVLPSRKKVIEALRRAVKDASCVYLAPDPDREGEAIAWHVAEALKIPASRTARITFNEITAPAVKKALQEPGVLDMDLVNSQQARRILDRLVGYKISPLLWKKVARGLSAGRVQSVAVRLIVEREDAVRSFKPEEYWKLVADLFSPQSPKDIFQAELLEFDGKNRKVRDGKLAEFLRKELVRSKWQIAALETKTTYSQSLPPFNTALIQSAAANRLGFGAKKTMRIAQQLYEGIELGTSGSVGLITYMRTDSFRVSDTSVAQVREFIKNEYGPAYLPAKPRAVATKKGAQDAHEAIRPTDVNLRPDAIQKYLTSEQFRLYKLIWHQFVASQMVPARFELVNADIKAANCLFRATGKRMLFDGHLKAAFARDKQDFQILPQMKVGDVLNLKELVASQHFTQPPARFTEATLVKALEREGIGRPSTYATIISTIQDRGYAKLQEKKFLPTELGELVTRKLVEHFPEIMAISFTRSMEEHLDDIETASREWLDVVREFYTPFMEALEKATEGMESEKGKVVDNGETCPDCNSPLVERISRFGRFFACSGYPKCKFVKRDTPPETKQEAVGECPECGGKLVEKSGKRGRFIACSGYPKCRYTRGADGSERKVKAAPVIVEGELCEKCNSPMVLRFSRRGPFMGCSKFPKCRGTKQLSQELKQKYAVKQAEQPSEQS